MLDIMYDAPMKKQVKTCHITKAVIDGHVSALDVNGPAPEDKNHKSARVSAVEAAPAKPSSADRVA